MRGSRAAVLVAALALISSCIEFSPDNSRDARLDGKKGEPVLQSELQQDVERFTGQFMDRLATATEPLSQDPDPDIRQAAQRLILLDMSAALDIATGPLPEINVLDMLVYLTLEIEVIERHWGPTVFGSEKIQPVIDAFVDSEKAMWPIAEKIMGPTQRQELREAIHSWQDNHPHQVHVEQVRFTDFSARAGEVAAERARSSRGLLGSVKGATQAADQALLLAERGLFLAQRMPFLIRMHARLGVQETISDTLFRFQNLRGLKDALANAPELEPLVVQISGLLERSESAMREGRALTDSLQPLISYATSPEVGDGGRPTTRLNDALDSSNRLADKALRLLDDLQQLAARVSVTSGKDPLTAVSDHADRVVRRWVGYLIVLGAAWALFFWGGYYLVKR